MILAHLINLILSAKIRNTILKKLYLWEWKNLFVEIISVEKDIKIIEDTIGKIDSLYYLKCIHSRTKQNTIRSIINDKINCFIFKAISEQAHNVKTMLDSGINYIELLLEKENSRKEWEKNEENIFLAFSNIISCFENIANEYNNNGNQLIAIIRRIRYYLIDQLDTIQFHIELYSKTEKDTLDYGKTQEVILVIFENIKNLLDNLFDLSYIKTNKIKIHKSIFNCNLLLSEVYNICRYSKYLNKNNIKLQVEINSNADFIYSDPKLLIKALINLIRNAYTFNKDCIIKFGVISHKSGCRFYISDSNSAQLTLTSSLEICFNDSPIIDGHLKLGLPIANYFLKSINENIDIKIDYNSSHSSMFITIPQEFVITNYNNTYGLESKNILLVENNIINQKIIILSLKGIVGNIDLANNGKEALDKFRSNKYDLILMDVRMPLIDGYSATKKIREIEVGNNLAQIPIIAITANSHPGDKEICLAAGMNDYLAKPFQIDLLVVKMINLLIETTK